MLTLLTLAVVAFVVTMRTERLASGNVLYRTNARQYVDAGLSEAVSLINAALSTNRSCYPVHGWSTNEAGLPHFFEQDCFGLPATNNAPIFLLRGSVTNLLPATLAAQARLVESGWVIIQETNAATGSDGIQAGRVSFLVVNLSGLMDVHALNADRCQALGEPNAGVTNLMNATGVYQRVFFTQPDITAANGGAVSNLVTFSYDPGPDVYFTNLTRFGTRAFTNDLFPRFNIILATNAAGLDAVSNLLANAGVPAADATAWNILNYQDAGRIPIGPAPTYRTGIGVKDVPLINEIALQDVSAPGTSNHYGVAVELWYPFVPHASPDSNKLWVAVFTNHDALAAAFAALGDKYDKPPPPMGLELPILPAMNYKSSTEFFVGSSSNANATQIFFPQVVIDYDINGQQIGTHTNYLSISAQNPVWIWPRVYVDGICVDEALLDATPGATSPVWTWTDVCSIQFSDPRANHVLSAQTSFTNPPSLGTTNANCSIPCLPLVHADAPMRSAGELRNIYAPGLSGGRIDFTTALGGACRDRFTVLASNAPVHGLFQANTPYTNIWQAILSDVTIGWTNQIFPGESFDKIGADPAALRLLASNVVQSLSGNSGWVCNQEMFPIMGSNMLSTVMTTNRVGGMDAQAVCGDILAGIADRVSFRQSSFLIIVCGQRLSPMGRVLADQRAACTIVRDAYTGRWVVDHMVWLTD
ncbi:MAG: hypothetical protein ACOYOU_12765 [Kiritimatiellia bacterium]